MTIRARLAYSISLLIAVSLGLVGSGVFWMSNSFNERDVRQRIEVIENSVRRVAQDALLQKDDLMLISYFNFLKTQYPSLAYAWIRWETPERSRSLGIGEAVRGPEIWGGLIRVSNPTSPSFRVIVQERIDRRLLYNAVASERRRLAKIIGLVSVVMTLFGFLFSFWFARSLTAPLSSLVKLASEIGSGKLGGKLAWHSDDEIGALVRVFNNMSQRLEELDEAKKNFVSSVTHELRSPLGAIESFLSLIEGKLTADSYGNAQCYNYIGRIRTNVQRLGNFISDLLDTAKIEKGGMECVLRPMSLREVAVDVCQFFEAKSKQQGVRLSHRVDGLPAVSGDPDRLRQVFVNLVANSLKFTPNGGHVFISGRHYDKDGDRWVEIVVGDTGRGIAKGDLNNLFSAFFQGRNVGEGVAGTRGTGLGLYIVKSIVENHGGAIGVRSELGRGTEIVFTLRAAGGPDAVTAEGSNGNKSPGDRR